ncbi:MAG TPA: acyltransferase [Candidatus Limnocylindrales bacterium]|nr:acyltransferase [Candidatus Limnocylindrales bacterium]
MIPTNIAGARGSDSRRIGEIDVLRGLAIAGVVMRHVSWQLLTPANLAAPGGSAIAIACILSDVGVSLFVAVSAFGLAWRYAAPFSGVRAWLGFLASRASRLLPAYVLWSIVSLAARDRALLSSPSDVGGALLFGTADVQFYYVPMVFELYILWPLVRPLAAMRSARGVIVVLAAGAAVAELVWRAVIPSPWTPLLYLSPAVATGLVLPMLLGNPAPGSNPFGAGAARRRALVPILIAAAAAALFVCASRFFAFAPEATSRGALFLVTMMSAAPQALLNCSLIAALALLATPLARTRAGGWIAALGRMSYGVFLVHLLVASTVVYRLFAIDTAAPGGAAGTVLRMTGAWLAVLLVSYAGTLLLARIPNLAWTVGLERAPRPETVG